MNLLAEIITTCAWSPIIWKNNYATSANFEYSFFLTLDFDDIGDETMEQINHSLQDHKRIIATTKSHQKNKNGVICDRFRLIIPWDKPITSYVSYKQNYQHVLKKYHWADKSCSDGARFFFPSQKIVYFDRDSEYAWETKELVIVENISSYEIRADRKIPPWHLDFINDGIIKGVSRNIKVFQVMSDLIKAGFTAEKTKEITLRAPINWNGVDVNSILKSVLKKGQRE